MRGTTFGRNHWYFHQEQSLSSLDVIITITAVVLALCILSALFCGCHPSWNCFPSCGLFGGRKVSSSSKNLVDSVELDRQSISSATFALRDVNCHPIVTQQVSNVSSHIDFYPSVCLNRELSTVQDLCRVREDSFSY